MKKTKHIVFVVVISLCFLFMVIAGIILLKRFNELQTMKTRLARAEDRLKQLFAANPFPSMENVEREKANVKELSTQYTELITRMKKGQIEEEPERKSPTAFMQLVGRKRQELQEKGNAADNAVPPNFQFGFDRYFATGAPNPAPDDVPKLSQQLAIIEKLCNVFIKPGVKLDAIVREEIEQTISSRYRKPVQESSLFRKLHFKFTIRVKESLLKQLLKELAQLDMFVVVNSLSVEKQSPDVRELKEPEVVKVASDTASSPPSETDISKEHPPRHKRVVCGPELEVPMTVVIGLTVYIFGGAM